MRAERKDGNDLGGAQKCVREGNGGRRACVVVEIVEDKGIVMRINKRERR